MTFRSGLMMGLGLMLAALAFHLNNQDQALMAAAAAFLSSVPMVYSMQQAFQGWQDYRIAMSLEARRSLHGDAKLADASKIRDAGLIGNDPRTSLHLGAANGRLLSYAGSSHLVTVAPNNEGKTESVVIPNALAIEHNAVITDKGGEVALATWRHRERLGYDCIFVSPWRMHVDKGLPAHRFNPVGRLVDLARNDDPDIIDEARGFADLLVPENPKAGDNKIFQDKGRTIIQWLLLHHAYQAAELGSPCSLAQLYDDLNGSTESLQRLFAEMQNTPHRLSGQIAKQGEALLSDSERSAKSFGAYVNNAQAGLMIYSPAGHIGKSVEVSDFDPAKLKSGKMTIYIVAPPEQLVGSGGKWAGLVLYSLLRTMWGARTAEPRVTILADEFANLSDGPIPLIPEVLKVGRSYGIQLWPFVQDLNSFARYGENQSLFQSQMAVQQFWQVRNVKDAEYWKPVRALKASSVKT